MQVWRHYKSFLWFVLKADYKYSGDRIETKPNSVLILQFQGRITSVFVLCMQKLHSDIKKKGKQLRDLI